MLDPEVRHQRLRRDAARTVGVGRQAAGGEPRDRGPGQRVRAARPRRRRAACDTRLSRRHSRVRPDAKPRCVVRAVRDRPQRATCAGLRRSRRSGSAPDARSPRHERATASRRSRSWRTCRRPTAHHRRSAAHRANRGHRRRHACGRAAGGAGGDPRRVQANAPGRPAPPAAPVPPRARGQEGRRRRQRRDAGLDRAHGRPRHRGPAVPSAQGGGAVLLEGFVRKSRFANNGERVVTGQRSCRQRATSSSAGPCPGGVRRQGARLLRPPAQGLEGLGGRGGLAAGGMALYGEMCGWTLARAHARSGDRIAIAAYLGSGDTFDRAMLSSRPPTPTRTSGTTTHWSPRSRPGESRRFRASSMFPKSILLKLTGPPAEPGPGAPPRAEPEVVHAGRRRPAGRRDTPSAGPPRDARAD